MLILEFNIIKTNFKIIQLKKLTREQFKENQFVKAQGSAVPVNNPMQFYQLLMNFYIHALKVKFPNTYSPRDIQAKTYI